MPDDEQEITGQDVQRTAAEELSALGQESALHVDWDSAIFTDPSIDPTVRHKPDDPKEAKVPEQVDNQGRAIDHAPIGVPSEAEPGNVDDSQLTKPCGRCGQDLQPHEQCKTPDGVYHFGCAQVEAMLARVDASGVPIVPTMRVEGSERV